MKRLFTILLLAFVTTTSFAQMGIDATIQNMHIWRGDEVADGLVITTDAHYTTSNDKFTIGFWGGVNTEGEYKEFNNYVNYHSKGLSITLFDTYNYSTYATYNNKEFFNYRPGESGRFLDATVKHQFGAQFPITLGWSTILFGRDRDASNKQNRYSTYCCAEYPIYKYDEWCVDAGFGAAFALNNVDNSANFYGDKAGIVEVTVRISYTITILNYNIPLSSTAMWNPQTNSGYLQLCAKVVSF